MKKRQTEYLFHIVENEAKEGIQTEATPENAFKLLSRKQALQEAAHLQQFDRNIDGTRLEQFTFPSEIALNNFKILKIDDYKKVRQFLQSELKKAGFGSDILKYYIERRTQNNNSKYFRLNCRFCSAMINFRKDHNGVYIVGKMTVQHRHIKKEYCSTTQERVYAYLNQKYSPTIPFSELANQAINKLSISQIQFTRHSKKFLNEHMNVFGNFLDYLKSHKFEIMYDWGEPKDKYPRTMVIVTPTMKKNFREYGDILSFDITYKMLKNTTNENQRYRLGVFCVTDTNIRILLAGIAILCDETTATMAKVFSFLFELHQKEPQSIVTDQQLSMESAIQLLRESDAYHGIHLFDPWHVLQTIKRKLKDRNEPSRNRQLMTLISKTIMTRDLLSYTQCLQKLMQEDYAEEMFGQFLQKTHKICYMDIPKAFISIKRFSCEKVNDLLKQLVPQQTTIPVVVAKIDCFDTYLREKSANQIKIFREKIERIYKDPKIHQVRLEIQKQVFERFLQNYSLGLENVVIESSKFDSSSGTYMFEISHFDTGCRNLVIDWKCNCNQLDKTGVPCPHLLMAARTIPEKQYIDLFNPRWRKQIPIFTAQKGYDWVKRGRGATTRSNQRWKPIRNKAIKSSNQDFNDV